MISWLNSFIQGLIQGLTEFLPVSSSGHLTLFQRLTGTTEIPLPFDLLLHLATVAATILFFRRDIFRFIVEFFSGFRSEEGRRTEGWRYGWTVIIGSVPTAVIGLLLKHWVEMATQSVTAVGAGLIITALLLFCASFLPSRNKRLGILVGIFVGIAQGFATFPGISRSGTTFVMGMLCGLSSAESFKFSFLLSLPAIIGAAFLELHSVSSFSLLPGGWLLGCLIAFISGLAALKIFSRLVVKTPWKWFALYCLVLGIFAIVIG